MLGCWAIHLISVLQTSVDVLRLQQQFNSIDWSSDGLRDDAGESSCNEVRHEVRRGSRGLRRRDGLFEETIVVITGTDWRLRQ